MSDVCKGTSCTVQEVGPFMDGISGQCYDAGSCQLPDIMTVFANVGNYAVGLVGALVFLMWVISGFRYLGANFFPGGFDENIKKGKQGIVTATIGLLIVFGAFAAIKTLEALLKGSDATPSGEVVDCTGREDGAVCGLNMECEGGVCMTGCAITGGKDGYSCFDTTDPSYSGRLTGCSTGACPGGESVQCCKLR